MHIISHYIYILYVYIYAHVFLYACTYVPHMENPTFSNMWIQQGLDSVSQEETCCKKGQGLQGGVVMS